MIICVWLAKFLKVPDVSSSEKHKSENKDITWSALLAYNNSII
jgi:hypothetical protein